MTPQYWTIPQVFSPEILKSVEALVNNAPLKYGWASNKKIDYTHWNHDFAHAGSENGLDIADRLPPELRIAWEFLQREYLGTQSLLRCYTNAHTFGVEGYPHTDSSRPHDYTLVIYMNQEWQRNWGGETMIYAGNQIVHAELPQFNHGLIFPGASWHSARSVTRVCPALRRTLMFKFAAPNCDSQRDRIQVFLQTLGADRIRHSGRNLQRHLLNTYDILHSTMQADQTTAAAGAMHSIFGTNAFKHKTVANRQREIVAAVIGEPATELVELFRDIDRPKTLESALANSSLDLALRDGSTRTVSESQLNSLCAIEVANLRDQNALSGWPHLSQFKLTRTNHAKK